MNHKSWTKAEKDYVQKNYKYQTIEEMADTLCKTPIAVSMFMSRNRIAISKLEKNIVIDLLKIKFVNPEYFRPTRAFYDATGFSQRLWWDFYHGRKKMTQEQYLAFCRHLKIELVDAFEAHQVQLFPSENHE